ncbi:CRISPR-associated helicase/endonuclease Cas3 [Bariatricus massiliensis]|uniref:CRISPR-associated helicase/endonuclease Cas3 n=1 Tax=Bariatricus massiliensis TaxID=1745713 RepID=A0ABS8DHC0_9FIRM|nr:CRISPR-associated helicase/endonuclease Cas3 [Bariatricus massiliensis]MCB7304812.1 CRISPR-associated helicase/endonuclease Cas3 [Bariatricus massiliensis]MCB7375366.1 CRISPR-associated helicase/endonuclease Cas3 [Bariatricus massiliensis]MCB7387826.1 CRISPR-associated helicase/endonuclease Cas3 [Bariatricus massiliensis]MCB7412085.1 CRISPR-associated helicase/endonuclease Cas3 [Bariatricus massiliensis]MCQ5254534.1 CRISPR-associated helicase/endonuclease Cas3 [Bariatricus massiliensis]
MEEAYIAHFREENEEVIIQTVSEHNSNVAFLSEKNSSLDRLSPIGRLIGFYHDAGKFRDEFLNYMKKNMEGERTYRGEVNHSTAGGYLLEQLAPNSIEAQMMEYPVFCHHGIADALSDSGRLLIEDRLKQEENVRQVSERFYEYHDRKELEHCFRECRKILHELLNALQEYAGLINEKERNLQKNFFVGMYERILLSLLIDADWTDTACFMQNQKIEERLQDKDGRKAVWAGCKEYFMAYMSRFPKDSKLSGIRSEILERCMRQGEGDGTLYRLTIPTGSGKTLSSLGFALSNAQAHNKKHIIYVAPFTSILEQNAEEIRKAVGNPDIVLEHHSNIFYEREEERKKQELLAENWASPIIVTTAVQFLNTLFSASSKNIRRMNNICNSVIIFDEIQALPVRTIKLFNLAVNFLSTFGESTIVLCSATQPLLDRILDCRLNRPLNMIEADKRYDEVFERTTIHDKTTLTKSGFTAEELGDFILERAEEEERVLVIVNTKKCAENTYKYLKEKCKGSEYLLFHLSTNMCPQNRQDILQEIKESLKDTDKKIICISTQLIEAGVDISFQCVVRSLAGLDSVVQAAGRCNRHKEVRNGNVYIVKMSKEAEHVSMLKDIVKAQVAMQSVLRRFGQEPSSLDGRLDSTKAIELYYGLYMDSRKEEMGYLVSVAGRDDTLLNMLSGNAKVWSAVKSRHGGSHKFLKQAFKTAGELFEVIPEDGKVDVVVEYDDAAKEQIGVLSNSYLTLNEQQQAIRKLQKYTVGISEWLKQALGNAITSVCDGKILVLSENYYSRETGVSEEPVMELMNF